MESSILLSLKASLPPMLVDMDGRPDYLPVVDYIAVVLYREYGENWPEFVNNLEFLFLDKKYNPYVLLHLRQVLSNVEYLKMESEKLKIAREKAKNKRH